MKKVAIVYDRVNKWGGAERVLLALHEIFRQAPLYTSVYNPEGAPWAKVFPEVKTSFLQKFPFARSNHELLAPFMSLAFESFDFTDFDLVVSVTSEAAKGIRTKPSTLHVCYCLTPTRYLWSHYEDYIRGQLIKAVTKPFVNYLRNWDKVSAARPDKIIAISTEVKSRIKKYYGRDSNIIFPPVNTVEISLNKKNKQKHYLVVSRLVGYKKVDLVIEAFNKLGYPLIIIGTGRQEKRLKRKAKDNIKFAGQVSEKDLSIYYSRAKALIMPQEEDFGIVAVEAQSFGVPVIAYKKGGAVDTVIDSKTGILFDQQNVQSLTAAVARFEKTKFVVDNLYTNAKRFSKEIFKTEVLDLISEYSRIKNI